MSARVFLGDFLTGELLPDPAAGRTEFEFDHVYASRGDRPVLGRCFEDRDITPPRRFRGAPLPNYFRNLLPEGALRKLVEPRLGPTALPEYTMLLRLGEHLPGAVRVLGDEIDPGVLEAEERRARSAGDPYRFALTGVQPKLSLYEHHDKLTVPLEGLEYVRRLVFMVLSGNHDAHRKNWALIYPDGLRARLAPVYDFVATVAYARLGPHPALRWSEPSAPTLEPEKPLEETTVGDLLVAASYSEADTSQVMEEISRFAALVREKWGEVSEGAPPLVRKRVSDHLSRAALE